ncbi:DUF262 domain-containing protein [Ancylobacter radicis]|uniref:DUF262 domain-containing protein n=1 Tax=Ancylobacter radicis TaxID=2836179 RepID=A0ABS5R965_9HYPH|nr:DUF262 domain-containing protein [Ancylobacter radicis]MBS9477421.1 DUF262 domain-containing protein [Ancylobacter radicis]
MRRRAEFRPFGWLHDLRVREQLDLEPPYQRRSVWPERYKVDFITTVLLGYPCPAIFLYEEININGSFLYKVVDGKQRLSSLFDFVDNKISVSDDYPNMNMRGKIFDELDDNSKLEVWRYSFSVEFIEQENETLINDIFNRINKNVAKLTAQELRHARFSGIFISQCEDLSNELDTILYPNFPNIAPQSRRQMKDVENLSTMLLFLEQGERSLSQTDIDKAYSERDEEWLSQYDTIAEFRRNIGYIADIIRQNNGNYITSSRLRNQADFYSLFAAVVELNRDGGAPTPDVAATKLAQWISRLKHVELMAETNDQYADEIMYLGAARAASNDAGPRRIRINAIKRVLGAP